MRHSLFSLNSYSCTRGSTVLFTLPLRSILVDYCVLLPSFSWFISTKVTYYSSSHTNPCVVEDPYTYYPFCLVNPGLRLTGTYCAIPWCSVRTPPLSSYKSCYFSISFPSLFSLSSIVH